MFDLQNDPNVPSFAHESKIEINISCKHLIHHKITRTLVGVF